MKAALDIGSNTVRMLLGEPMAGRICPERYLRTITRLGGGYDPQVGIAADAAERTIVALEAYARVLAEVRPEQIRAVATEAVRRAGNRNVFVEAVRRRTGISVEIISGAEEAAFSCAGVLAALDPRPGSALIFDLGGGSTEFVVLQGDETLWQKSYPLGVVSLAEAAQPAQSIAQLLTELAEDLNKVGLLDAVRSAACVPVGTAGTVTTLAAVALGMTNYDWRRINNFELTSIALQQMQQRFLPLTPSEREAMPGMEPGRGDLIVHGMEIVLGLLDLCGKERLRVSDFGLLEGVLLSMA